jgi:tryptophanyl-tRNA synthetase
LLFNSNRVPVGRDQIQHIEMARDIGARFNHLYGEHFVLPEAAIEEHVATLPGLDGRKMSKSYDNTIPLFCPRDVLKKLIAGIVTDSRAPGEPKDADGSNVFQLYQAFASAEETAAMRQAFADGIGWGDAKQKLFERIDAEIAPLRERYDVLIANPATIEEHLRHGAEKARVLAKPQLAKLREAMGLRNLASASTSVAREKPKAALPTFKQYREADGKFYFKLIDGDGTVLFISLGFSSGQQAAQEKHQLSMMVGDAGLAVLSEASQAVSVATGYRFEIRDPAENVIFGSGPIVDSPNESRRLRARFLEVITSMQE